MALGCAIEFARWQHPTVERRARFAFTYRTAFMTTGLDRTYHAHRFIFSFTF